MSEPLKPGTFRGLIEQVQALAEAEGCSLGEAADLLERWCNIMNMTKQLADSAARIVRSTTSRVQ